jgi:hypothetical protein
MIEFEIEWEEGCGGGEYILESVGEYKVEGGRKRRNEMRKDEMKTTS